ncbi:MULTISPECIES: hypothetical protein [unclassified Streptomyces]|uniref:hypothetical protein n=1 Tax=unclassified Streptomyces TaxID=2593676 RepID=UPI0033168C11
MASKKDLDFRKLSSELSDGEVMKFMETVREHLTPEVLERTEGQERVFVCTDNYCVVVRPK